MSSEEASAFHEYHRGHLLRILEQAEKIAELTSPHWEYHFKPGAKPMVLMPSDFKDLFDSDLTEDERQALSTLNYQYSKDAFSALASAITLGIMDQARGVGEQDAARLLMEVQARSIERVLNDSLEAWSSNYSFVDKEAEQAFDVRRTHVNSVGLEGRPIDVEVVELKTTDLVVEMLTVIRLGDDLRVRYDIEPVQDELLTRLVEVSKVAQDHTPETYGQLYEAGIHAMVGWAGALDDLADIQSKLKDDPEVDELCIQLRHRNEAVIATKHLEAQTSLPTFDKLEDTTLLLAAIVDKLED